MKSAILIHGTESKPGSNWFPWLAEELKKRGYAIFIPQFPTPVGQSLEGWRKEFKRFEMHITEETIFVGHSLGCAFILDCLERSEKGVAAVILVAGFVGLLGNPHYDFLNSTFIEKKFLWENIRSKCGKCVVISSDNDPYVPLEKGWELARHLGVQPIILHNAGHINRSSGFTEFPQVLRYIP